MKVYKGRRLSFSAVAFWVALWLAASEAASASSCLKSSLNEGLVLGSLSRTVPQQRVAVLRNHVRFADDKYQILLPLGGGKYKVVQFDDFTEAAKVLETITDPIDVSAIISRYASGFDKVDEYFRNIAMQKSVAVTSRQKDFVRLKDKMFDRSVKKQNWELSRLDDIIGWRFVAEDKNQIDDLVKSIKKTPGTKVKFYEKRISPRGYRAHHVILEMPDGRVVEVQVMTKRMSRWSAWNHDRVYKPSSAKDDPYLAKLTEYNRAIIEYLNGLDDGVKLQAIPRAHDHGIRTEDIFPTEWLQ